MMEYLLIGGGLVVMYLMKTGKIRLSSLECDIPVDSQFGMNLIKNMMIQCPDGDVRFAGANRNKNGTYDIYTTDGRVLRGVDDRRNIKNAVSPIDEMSGRGFKLCNIRISGGEVDWHEWLGHDTRYEYMFDLYDNERRRNTNIVSMGFNQYDGGLFDRTQADEAKRVGKLLRDYGISNRGFGESPTEVSLHERRFDEAEDRSAY
jgi:hypothetical protein